MSHRAGAMISSFAPPDHAAAIRIGAALYVTALTAVAAQISLPLPFTPVPLTVQSMVVLLGGAALGSKLGMSSQLLYLALGCMGAPVFAASPVLPQGAARLLGPTGGYLLCFPIAAYMAGAFAERGFDRRFATSLCAMAAGLALILSGGIAWMAWLQPVPVGFAAAFFAGFHPFFLVDIAKLVVAAAVLPTAWRFVPNVERRT